MQSVVVGAAAVWGLVGGAGAAVAPWRRWFARAGPPRDDAPARANAVVLAALGAAVCAALALRTAPRPELAVWLLLVPVGLLLARIDLTARRLPDALTLPSAGGAALLLGLAALLPGHTGSWTRALAGGVVLGAFYGLLMLVNPDGMGFGDVKLAPALGLSLGWYGWRALAAGTLLAFVLGACTGLALLAAGRADRRTALPFGPFMLTGALAALWWAAG